MITAKIKKTLDPSLVTAITDTREQTPVNLAPLRTIRGTLPTGDYSVVGLEHVIAVERKSLDDLVACCGVERERFEREVQRLLAYPVGILVVESNWATIKAAKYRSKMHPNAVIGSLINWQVAGLRIVLADDHENAGQHISRILFAAARKRYNEAMSFFTEVSGASEPRPPGLDIPALDLRNLG